MITEARNSGLAARVVGNKWVRIHVPRVAQLAHISSPTLGSVEAAQGESHSFSNCRGGQVVAHLRNHIEKKAVFPADATMSVASAKETCLIIVSQVT